MPSKHHCLRVERIFGHHAHKNNHGCSILLISLFMTLIHLLSQIVHDEGLIHLLTFFYEELRLGIAGLQTILNVDLCSLKALPGCHEHRQQVAVLQDIEGRIHWRLSGSPPDGAASASTA